MAGITIYVSRIGNSNNLRLRDSEDHDPGNDLLTTDVNTSDIITWIKDPRANSPAQPGYSPIECITSITKADSSLPQYRNSIPVLTANPTVSECSAIGYVLAISPGSGKFENYTIYYTLPGDSTIHHDDPQLRMKN